MSEPLWPTDYNVSDDHCGDVLRGSYDVPYNPDHPPVVLDIGANVGAFARWAAERWPGCEVHSYEPNPKVLPLLHRTIKDHNLLCSTHQCAVSNKDGEADLSEGPHNCGEGSIVSDFGTTKHKVHVLDAANLPFANVLKLDTEGCELQILMRLHDVNRLETFSAVMMETHSPQDREAIMALMANAGFTLTKDHIWFRGGGIKYCDPTRSEICYVRKDLVPPDFKPVITDTSPKKPLVWIATPMRTLEANGLMSQEDVAKLPEHYREPLKQLFAAGMADQLPWRFELYLVGGGGVARARNKAVTDFIASGAEFLFWQDLDILATPQNFVDVLCRMVANKLPIVGGLYTTREKNGHWVFNFPDMNGVQAGWALNVLETGTGFKCYHRSVFEKVLKDNPWLKCQNDDHHQVEYGFFSMGPVEDKHLWPGHNRWLTEDFWLDWLTRESGFPIVLDTKVLLKHHDDAPHVKIVPKTLKHEKALKLLERDFGGQIFVQGPPTIYPAVFPQLPQMMSEEEKKINGKMVNMPKFADGVKSMVPA